MIHSACADTRTWAANKQESNAKPGEPEKKTRRKEQVEGSAAGELHARPAAHSMQTPSSVRLGHPDGVALHLALKSLVSTRIPRSSPLSTSLSPFSFLSVKPCATTSNHDASTGGHLPQHLPQVILLCPPSPRPPRLPRHRRHNQALPSY